MSHQKPLLVSAKHSMAALALIVLTSCAKPSSPISPLPPSVCVQTRAEPAIEGGLVQAVTPEEIEAQRTFLQSVAAVLDWGREGWGRAETARKSCPD